MRTEALAAEVGEMQIPEPVRWEVLIEPEARCPRRERTLKAKPS
jgi:hypothetical protein